jgi:hypothetical protein
MPYIRQELREHVRNVGAETVGELNYSISFLVNDWVLANGLSYQTINDISGVLQKVQSEFDRCVAGPYEEKKRQENGDVWTCLDRSPLNDGEPPYEDSLFLIGEDPHPDSFRKLFLEWPRARYDNVQ